MSKVEQIQLICQKLQDEEGIQEKAKLSHILDLQKFLTGVSLLKAQMY